MFEGPSHQNPISFNSVHCKGLSKEIVVGVQESERILMCLTSGSSGQVFGL